MNKNEEMDLIRKGFRLLRNGDIHDAIMIANEAIETQANNPYAWVLSASCKSQRGEVEDAIYEYKRAIQLSPNNADFYFDLGAIYERIENLQEALYNYQKAVQLDPGDIENQTALARTLIKKKMFKEAIDLLEKCIKEEPDNEAYNNLLGMAYNDFVMNDWHALDDNSRLCCTAEAANKGVEYLRKAFALRFKNDGLESLIFNNLVLAEWSIKKHWTRSILETVKGGFKALIAGIILGMILELVFADNGGSVIGIISVVGVLVVWIVTGFKPGWEINKMAISQLR